MDLCISHCAPTGLNECLYLHTCPSVCSFKCNCEWFIGSSMSDCLGVFCVTVCMCCTHESANLCVDVFSQFWFVWMGMHLCKFVGLWVQLWLYMCVVPVYMYVCVPTMLISVCIFIYVHLYMGLMDLVVWLYVSQYNPRGFMLSALSTHVCPPVLKSNKTVATRICPGVDGMVQLLLYTNHSILELWKAFNQEHVV